MRYARTLLALALVTAPVVMEAQVRNPGGRGGRRGGLVGQPQDSTPRNRAMLEGEIRQRMARQMQTRLGLSEAQMTKVREINARYADRRQTVMQQERDVRMSLRDEMITADSSRQQAVADLLDRMLRVQRQRLEIQEQEQRDLATVLTPFQRATYMGFEEQVRQRIEQMRQQGGRMGPPPGGAPPNGPPIQP
ncbi:MAG: hypothetical protein P3A28_00630 [Gemmatimonadota bacterium]|nr:hypothetical protein [Gemmatimonadota bacterium]